MEQQKVLLEELEREGILSRLEFITLLEQRDVALDEKVFIKAN